ncbi:MAG: adenylate/guanylate cyclase domain-containing protein [Cryomorphaceae bacterium]|nr:adenylate/guanylate cyclase domain-containing protein [Cryomorphaceae bacterium]
MDNIQQWDKQKLIDEVNDLKNLYETIAEHSSVMENELELKNRDISNLINQLKKYLSPQLFESIVGNGQEVTLSYKRKFLTIFFSDIVSFTEISDRTDPEVLSDLLNGYLNDMALIAHKHGGTIDKFIGDALMVFFGDPQFINDKQHAEDCCAMAIEMQVKCQEIDKKWKNKGIEHGLKARMGIHSGYCTVGNFGSENRMDYTIIGGNVNIASRLESLAKPGSIFISSVTKNLLSPTFNTSFKQKLEIRGIHFPVEVHELNSIGHSKEKLLLENNPYLQITENGFAFKENISFSELQSISNRHHLTTALELLLQKIKL